MRWNATFRYRKNPTQRRDANGFLIDASASPFVDGSLCQVERNAPAKHFVGTDGQEFVYDYNVYLPKEFCAVVGIGDVLEITLDDGTVIEKSIIGVDITDKKTCAVWL